MHDEVTREMYLMKFSPAQVIAVNQPPQQGGSGTMDCAQRVNQTALLTLRSHYWIHSEEGGDGNPSHVSHHECSKKPQ